MNLLYKYIKFYIDLIISLYFNLYKFNLSQSFSYFISISLFGALAHSLLR